jgi:hypothetical protein
MFEDLTDDELQRIEDIQFEDKLSIFVAQLPPPSPDMERAYQAKMDLLQQIHDEVFPPSPVGGECDDPNTYDSRYYHEYQLSFGSHNSFD